MKWLIPISCTLFALQPLAAEISLAPLFQKGAVLQRGKPVPVWGRAEANGKVIVSFAGQEESTEADATGSWHVTLAPLEAAAIGRTLSVSCGSSATVEIHDVVVGELWLASGQSNMQWSIAQTRQEDQDLAAAGPVPLLRLFDVPRVLSSNRNETVNARWTPATPESARGFSAVGYFFGKNLAEELQVPVGIIHSSWGGSRIEPWWAEEGLDGIPELAETRSHRLARSPGFPEYDRPFRKYVDEVAEWADLAAHALDDGFAAPEMPRGPAQLPLGHNKEAGTYQAMIHPLVPAALRGFIWYQGESNNGDGMLYTAKMRALIQGWRKQFNAPEAPFLFAQLAPYNYGPQRDEDLPRIWWAQQQSLAVPHTGMAVISDIGNPSDIHPRNKSEVARRLALWALADSYGKSDIVKSGPLFATYEPVDGGIVILFNHAGSGLTTRDGKAPDHFEIAGPDEIWKPATVSISKKGDSVLLAHPEIRQPDRARFAWSQTAVPNLMNREGLPAAAFNTHWPADPTLGTRVSNLKPHLASHPNTYGWDGGLTDGVWGDDSHTCHATNADPTFPKTVTLDLGESTTIHAVLYGTPAIGATKTVAISISTDGKSFTEIDRHDFPAKQASRRQARFTPRPARYVRVTFLAQHPKQDNYDENFAFLSELEVYQP